MYESREVDRGEDATKYGEFVCSYFGWITQDKQREKVEELQNITKINKRKKKY